MIFRFAPHFFLSTALLLAAAAGYAYYLTTDVPGAVVDEPDREFPALAVGNNNVQFRVHNPTRHTVRVIGCGEC